MDDQQTEIPEDIAALRRRVEVWRRTRTKRSPMPDELWQEAARLAKTHGYRRVARALRANYDSLKAKVEKAPRTSGAQEPGGGTASPATFVEVSTSEIFAARQSPTTVVEMTDETGVRITIRLAEGEKLDVPGLVDAFRGRHA